MNFRCCCTDWSWSAAADRCSCPPCCGCAGGHPAHVSSAELAGPRIHRRAHPLHQLFLTSNYVTQFAVPEYLLGVLRATTRYHALYLAIVVLLVLLFLSCALVLPPVCPGAPQPVAGRPGERRVSCGSEFFRTALLLLRWNLSAVLRSGSLALCVLAPLYAVILGIGLQNTTAMVALSRASLLVEVPFFQFLLDCSITIAQCSILFLLYRRLRRVMPCRRIPRMGTPVRAKGRRLLAAAVVGVTLVTIGLSFIYIALPADDELRTMLGGAAPIVTAHRGYSTAAPENTLPAFQLAIGHHSDRAELDVQMTKDGVVMVTHDTSLRRCTGRNANIYDLTFAQVRELDAGRWFSARYAGTQIPTLEEVLDLCKGKIQLNIEIKPNAATPELEAETVRIIREKGFEKDCVITSQSYETLCKVKELDPEIETGLYSGAGRGHLLRPACRRLFPAWNPPLLPPAWCSRSICAARRCPPGRSIVRRTPVTC